MKGLIGILIIVGAILGGVTAIAKTYYISPGNVGVLIYKGGQTDTGVAPVALTPGWGMTKLFTEDIQEYPVYMQTAVWTKDKTEGSKNDDSITVSSVEGSPVNIDVSMSYTLDPLKVPALYVKYRSNIETIQNSFLRQSVRQAAQNVFGRYSVEDIYGAKKEEIAGLIQKSLNDTVGQDGFNFTQFTINRTGLEPAIINSINQKIQAGQDALKSEQTLKRIEIEAKQRVAEANGNAEARITNAKAEAESIKIQAEAIQSQGGADYVKLKAIEKWNGTVPTTMVPGSTVPFIDLNK